jgi:N-acetylglucosaminyldiphosphoundecaprenol N-acetyl-beta-D-mannosaminyltransferase
MKRFPTQDVLGVPIAALAMPQVLDVVHESVSSKQGLHIGVVNAAKIVNMRRNVRLRQAVLESDIILADGMSVVWASRVLGRRLPERVAGIDLMFGILERGDQHRYRVYLFGARQEIIEEVARRVSGDYPGVEVVGYRNGYYDADDEPQIAADIASARPDVLFVAMTSPKKEQFLARWNETMRVSVTHGVGGSFDVYAGMVQRAPRLWQKLGLEWLYRLLQEPGRLWKRYLDTNSVFLWLVASEWLTRRGRVGSAHRESP